MASFRDRDRRLFPLRNISDVLRLFRAQLQQKPSGSNHHHHHKNNHEHEPNLSLLSIVIGAIENSLTNARCNLAAAPVTHRSGSVESAVAADTPPSPPAASGTGCSDSGAAFPVLTLRTVDALYQKFQSQIKGSVDLSQFRTSTGYASRELVKKVSDVIWSSLTRAAYKDRAHLQSLFSYLTGNKLDCFGVAYAVVAACQILGYKDVHLALSEDHAWVVFGKNCEETAEVTWHGKGNEDKRGQPITLGVAEKNWLYLNGHSVICSREMELAAMVSGMNPSINATTDNVELSVLQQELLWLLYDEGHLTRYPMALGNLGDLEVINPSEGRPCQLDLFHGAISAARKYYGDQHVYPYTYLGGYLYRHQQYKEALEAWANAADVIKKYNYNREDEEIYKEFLEIANELIPHIMKAVTGGARELDDDGGTPQLLRDPECFTHLLRFYDGICKWEEGSSTPVLHIGWARPLVNTIAKFDARVRSLVDIRVESDQPQTSEHVLSPAEVAVVAQEVVVADEAANNNNNNDTNKKNNNLIDGATVDRSTNGDSKRSTSRKRKKESSGRRDQRKKRSRRSKRREETAGHSPASSTAPSGGRHRGHRRLPDFIRSLETQINPNEAPHPNIAALAAACADNILNPEYLLGSGEPFSSSRSGSSSSSSSSSSGSSSRLTDSGVGGKLDCRDFLSSQSNGIDPFPGIDSIDSMLAAETTIPADLLQSITGAVGDLVPPPTPPSSTADAVEASATTDDRLTTEMAASTCCEERALPAITLQSEKMKGLKDLLLCEKLNVSAIQLQLTAQSQVHVIRRARSSSAHEFQFIGLGGAGLDVGFRRATKRSRRD